MDPNPSGGHKKILLVDDDAAIRMVVRGFLEPSGYHIWEAGSGAEALKVWREKAAEIDMLLTDMSMPGGLSGWQLADKMREENPGLKVVVMSGYAPEKTEQPQVHGHILQKPFTLEELTSMVRRCLDAAAPLKFDR